MAGLSGARPGQNYNGLLKTKNNTAVDGTKQRVTDGEGNDTSVHISNDKLWVENLNLENAEFDSSVNIALVIDGSGDVKKRTMNSNVFSPSLQNRILAQSNGAQSTPVVFYETGTGSTDSFSVGEGLTLNGSSNGVVVSGSGNICKATANIKLRFIENDAEGTLSITRNGSALITKNVINNFSVESAEDVVMISAPFITQTSADDIAITFTSTSDTIKVQELSCLDVEILS
jgi:hypothetical protein